MDELDREIEKAIARVDRIERVTKELRRRGIKPDSEITTAFNQLQQAKVDLANLQLQQINKNHHGIRITLPGN